MNPGMTSAVMPSAQERASPFWFRLGPHALEQRERLLGPVGLAVRTRVGIPVRDGIWARVIVRRPAQKGGET